MATAKEELRDRIARRLLDSEVRDAAVFADIAAGVGAASAGVKQSIVDAYKRKNAEALGRIIIEATDVNLLATTATTEADTILGDNQMSIDEITRVFPNG